MTNPSPAPSRVSDARYFLKAALTGILVGLIATAFHRALEQILSHYTEVRAAMPDGVLYLAVPMILSALCVLAAARLVARVAPEAAGSGIQEIEGAMEDLRTIRPLRIIITKFFGGLLALGSGLVLGREGPTIHMGAATAQALSGSALLDSTDKKGLLAAGAAAGLAAAFNAPLAAILFIVEETRRQFPFNYRTYMAVIIAALVSAAVTEQLAGIGPPLQVSVGYVPVWSFPLLALLGVFLGGLGVVFNKVLVATMDLFARLQGPSKWLPALAIGASSGFLLVVLPNATGGGEDLVSGLILNNNGIAVLLALTVLRFIGVLISYSAGVPGGIFAPMLSIATCAGLAFGVTTEWILPVEDGFQRACAIAAMGGFFAASVRAPIVGVVLVMEITGAYTLMMPVLITCASASLTAHHLGGRPIYETLLERTLRLSGQTVPAEDDRTPIQLGTRDT